MAQSLGCFSLNEKYFGYDPGSFISFDMELEKCLKFCSMNKYLWLCKG
jgi:hypothetical protein